MGLRVGLCDSSESPAAARSRYVTDFFHTCSPRCETQYVESLARIAGECSAKFLIPVFYPEVVARHRAVFPPDLIIPVDEAEKLELLDNKLSCCDLAESLGVVQPRRYSGLDEIPEYPVVFKRALGHGGDSVYFPRNRETLDHLLSNSREGTYLITEEIHGAEMSVDALRWGNFFAASAYRVILPKAKGASVLRESVDAPALIDAARKILDALDYRGVCGLDFCVDAGGRAYFLECNPRFSGGLASSIASGFDLPRLLLDAAQGRPLPDPAGLKLRTGVRTQSVSGSIAYLKRRRRQGKLTAGDILALLFSGARAYDDRF